MALLIVSCVLDCNRLMEDCQPKSAFCARSRKHHSRHTSLAPVPPDNPSQHECLIKGPDGAFCLNPRYQLQRELYKSDASPTIVGVYLDTDLQVEVILKQVQKRKLISPAQWASARREIDIHQSLSHLNIIAFLDGGETEDDFYLLLEYVPDSDYFSNRIEVNNQPFCTRKDAVDKFRSYTFDILMGLAYLHENGIIHMDLKPANLLLDRKVDMLEYPLVKLCDFGLSRRVSDDGGIIIEKKCGTNNFVAPEVRDQARVTPAVDIWCLGVLLHILAVGYPPHALRWKPGEELKFGARHWRKYENTGLQDLISNCLKLDPRERISASEALSHPWIILGKDVLVVN